MKLAAFFYQGKSHGPHCGARMWPMICRDCGEEILYFCCDCGCKVFFDEGFPNWKYHQCAPPKTKRKKARKPFNAFVWIKTTVINQLREQGVAVSESVYGWDESVIAKHGVYLVVGNQDAERVVEYIREMGFHPKHALTTHGDATCVAFMPSQVQQRQAQMQSRLHLFSEEISIHGKCAIRLTALNRHMWQAVGHTKAIDRLESLFRRHGFSSSRVGHVVGNQDRLTAKASIFMMLRSYLTTKDEDLL